MYMEILNLRLSQLKNIWHHMSAETSYGCRLQLSTVYPSSSTQQTMVETCSKAGMRNVKHWNFSTFIQPHPIFIISVQGGEQRELLNTTISMICAWFTLSPLSVIVNNISVIQMGILLSSLPKKDCFHGRTLRDWSLNLLRLFVCCPTVTFWQSSDQKLYLKKLS